MISKPMPNYISYRVYLHFSHPQLQPAFAYLIDSTIQLNFLSLIDFTHETSKPMTTSFASELFTPRFDDFIPNSDKQRQQQTVSRIRRTFISRRLRSCRQTQFAALHSSGIEFASSPLNYIGTNRLETFPTLLSCCPPETR
jgi:hypothetical protein